MFSKSGLDDAQDSLTSIVDSQGHIPLNTRDNSLAMSLFPRISDADAAWQQLMDASLGNPYQSRSWLEAWSAEIGQSLGVQPVIAVGKIAGTPLVILPLGIERRAGLRTLSFLGHQNGNQNTGIWDADFYAEVTDTQIESLLVQIAGQAGADLVSLTNIPEVWHARSHPLLFRSTLSSPSPVFARDLPTDFEELFRSTHSKSSRKNLLRKQRHLESLEGYRIVRSTTPEDIRRALSAFLQQRSKRARETGIPNAFSTPAGQQFLARALGIADVNTGQASLDVWFLEADGAIRATYLCVEHAGTLYAYSNSVAHDELLPNSPGLVLMKKIIQYACAAEHLKTIDLGLGEERYKTAWADPLPLRDSLVSMTLKGRIGQGCDRFVTGMKSNLRNSKTIWKIVRRARKLKANLKNG